jgi:hypothetical protein
MGVAAPTLLAASATRLDVPRAIVAAQVMAQTRIGGTFVDDIDAGLLRLPGSRRPREPSMIVDPGVELELEMAMAMGMDMGGPPWARHRCTWNASVNGRDDVKDDAFQGRSCVPGG